MRDVVNCIHNITSRIVIMDRKRKLETAARLQLRWQRWEVTNYDYLMQVQFGTHRVAFLESLTASSLHQLWLTGSPLSLHEARSCIICTTGSGKTWQHP